MASVEPKTLMSYDPHAWNSLRPVHGGTLVPVGLSTEPPSEDTFPHIEQPFDSFFNFFHRNEPGPSKAKARATETPYQPDQIITYLNEYPSSWYDLSISWQPVHLPDIKLPKKAKTKKTVSLSANLFLQYHLSYIKLVPLCNSRWSSSI